MTASAESLSLSTGSTDATPRIAADYGAKVISFDFTAADSRLDLLAAEYHQLGMFEEAAEVAERIVAARPLDPQAHLHAGVYHLLYTVDRHRARADFMAALRLRPGYSEAQAFLHLMDEQERAAADHSAPQARLGCPTSIVERAGKSLGVGFERRGLRQMGQQIEAAADSRIAPTLG